ncbi:MAG: hypothetical protein AABX47_10695 [Nanoarchaeota archaeon]
MKDGLEKELDNEPGNKTDDPDTSSLTTQDIGGLISLVMKKRGYPDPSQQDLVAMVSGATGATKQEVEAVVQEYRSQYPIMKMDGGLEATPANDALTNRWSFGVDSPELLLKPLDLIGTSFNSWPKSYAYISAISLVSVGAITGGLLGITTTGLMAAAIGITKIAAYVLWANGWTLQQRIQIIDTRTDIGSDEKDRLSRETFSKWLGQLANDATPQIADEIYGYTKNEGIPLINAARYLSRVHTISQSIPTNPLIYEHHSPQPDANGIEWCVDKSLATSIEATKTYLHYLLNRNIQREVAIKILDDCGKHMTHHYDQCAIKYQLRQRITWFGKLYLADSGDFKPATAIVNRAIKLLGQIYGPIKELGSSNSALK